MRRSARFVVALYAPRTPRACDALGRYLEGAGLKTSLRLPHPAAASKLRYGMLPYGSYQLATRNGKVPSRDVVEEAVQQAYARLKAKFGEVALDLNGTLHGSLPKAH